jgi:hypothetical protein
LRAAKNVVAIEAIAVILSETEVKIKMSQNIFLRLVLFGALFSCIASLASADIVTYDVTVDTSSITGTAGSLDFNFNPGPLVTQLANLQILNFASDGTLAGNCPCGTGDVSGQLPGTLTFGNGTALNDYFDQFTFGTTISFDVSLYGPALASPDGTSTSGSTFAFSMFSDSGGTVPALTSDTTEGIAFAVDVNLDGTTTVTNNSDQTTVNAESSSGPPSTVPEPGSALLILTMLAMSAGLARFRECLAAGARLRIHWGTARRSGCRTSL